MAEPVQGQSSSKKSEKGKKVQEIPIGEKFDVTSFIERVTVLDASELAIDDPTKSSTFGQVRSLDYSHVKSLVENYKRNPPLELELTVFQDPSMFIIRNYE